MTPAVSILMTSYEAGAYLQQAIDSVLNQTYQDFELLIMDDGSTDPLVSEALAGVTDPRVTITRLHPSAAGRAASCRYAALINLAAQSATGRYLTYLCSDDFYALDRLERMVKVLNGADIAYGSQTLIFESGAQFGVRQTAGVLTDAYERVDLNSVCHRRECFDRVGGWPDSPDIWRNADAHFWKRLTDAGYVFTPVPGAPTDTKRYRLASVDQRCIAGLTPWQ